MNKKQMVTLMLTLLAALVSGCANQKSDVRSNANFQSGQSIYVEHLPADGRGIDLLIAQNLRLRGFQAQSGDSATAPASADYILSYQDHWMWDMTMYMLQLEIQIRDRTGSTLATGESYRPSLQRQPPRVMVDETLDEIFSKTNPSLVTPEEESEDSSATRKGGRSSAGESSHEF